MNNPLKIILILILNIITNICNAQNFISAYSGSKFLCGINGFKTDSLNNRMLMYGNILDVACTLNSNYLAINTNNNWSFLGPFNHSLFGAEIFNNEIYACGWFTNVNGSNINSLAKYNGTNWVAVPNFISVAKPYNLKVINNELYLSGDVIYTTDGIFNGLAKFNGTNWSGFNIPFLGSGSYILDFCFYQGELYLGGNFRILPSYDADLIYYHNSQWQKVGSGINGANSEIKRLIVYNNLLYIGGLIYKDEGHPSNMLIAWDGSNLLPVGEGLRFNLNSNTTAQVHDMKVKNGKLFVAGGFNYAGNVFSCGLTVFDGNKFCSANKTPQSSVGLFAIGFYKDTLWVAGSNIYLGDTINNVGKFVGSTFMDTCSANYAVAVNEYINTINSFSIFPNPSNQEFNISISENTNISINITNTLGQKIYSINNVNKNLKLDCSNWENGIYYINVSSNGANKTYKFIRN